MNGRHGAITKLRQAANIARRNHRRAGAFQIALLARLQLPGDFRLHQIIRPRGTAADMPLCRFLYRETRLHQQRLGFRRNLLPMLKRTGRMIRHRKPRRLPAWRIAKACQNFRNIGSQARHFLGPIAPRGFFLPEHEAVILERGAAAGRIHHNRIQPLTLNLSRPGSDIGARQAHGGIMMAHVMIERAAAALILRHHHLNPHPVEQPDRRLIDRRGQHLLRAAHQQANAPAPFALRGKHTRAFNRRRRWHLRGRQTQHGAQPCRHGGGTRHQPRKRPRQAGPYQGKPKPAGIGQNRRKQPPQETLRRRALIGLFNIGPRMIHQMHVMHA